MCFTSWFSACYHVAHNPSTTVHCSLWVRAGARNKAHFSWVFHYLLACFAWVKEHTGDGHEVSSSFSCILLACFSNDCLWMGWWFSYLFLYVMTFSSCLVYSVFNFSLTLSSNGSCCLYSWWYIASCAESVMRHWCYQWLSSKEQH